MVKPIASSLLGSPHLTAIDDVIRDRWADFEWSDIMVYMLDLVPAAALPSLASQFDMLGYKGWVLTDTEEERRELIKNAIAIKSKVGTPGAMKRAFAALGYPNITIIEGRTDPKYDGEYIHDGDIDYGSGNINWAVFSVIVDIGDTKGLSTSVIAAMRTVIEEYKPARCKLQYLTFTASIRETVSVDDSSLVVSIG